MQILGRKIFQLPDGRIGFNCPACRIPHVVPLKNGPGRNWGYNGNPDRPTLTPCIVWEHGDTYCHASVSDGEITFFSDSYHDMAGETYDLPDVVDALVPESD